MNKHTLMALAAAAAIFSLQPFTRAADTSEPGALREQLRETARQLNLTEAQKPKMLAIMRARAEKLRELREDKNLSRAEKIAKFKAGREELAAEVKKVLTPEQFEKWKTTQGQLPAPGAPAAPGARVQEAIKELNLTAEQKEQLKPLYRAQVEKLRQVRQDTSLSVTQKLDKIQALRQEVAPKLEKVLTAEQYAKWGKEFERWGEQLEQRLQEKNSN
ncbi:MAG TPA: hypothetical protein PLC99_04195 [Verrucomicrobiota bacterium]|nr:hypothetical protein [Verrucomicrobiota bacterium]